MLLAYPRMFSRIKAEKMQFAGSKSSIHQMVMFHIVHSSANISNDLVMNRGHVATNHENDTCFGNGLVMALVKTHNIRVFRHIKVTFKKKLLVEYTSKSSSYE